MNDHPSVPASPPTLSKGRLWTALITPGGLTLIASAAIKVMPGWPHGTKIALAMLILPALLILIFGLLAHFQKTIYQRYRGRSTDFLCVAYFLGQTIVCLALWLGSLLLLDGFRTP